MRPSVWLRSLVVTLTVAAASSAHGQVAPSDPGFSEGDRADLLYTQGNLVGALPLYEHLVAQEPDNAVFAERLAYCLVGKLTPLPAGAERDALIARIRSEAEKARSLGDHSNLLQTILDSVNRPEAAQNHYSDQLNSAEAPKRRLPQLDARDGSGSGSWPRSTSAKHLKARFRGRSTTRNCVLQNACMPWSWRTNTA